MDQSEGVSFGFFERHIEEFSISILPLIWFSYIDHIFGESCCFPLRLLPCVFITVLSLMGLLYIFDLHACRHVCVTLDHCVPWSHHSHTHTHMGLVKARPNPERPESSGRALGLGPLQLATGSQESNNWVASQLQGTARLFLQRSQIGGKWVITGSEIDSMITALQSFK